MLNNIIFVIFNLNYTISNENKIYIYIYIYIMFLFRRCSHKVKSCKQPMTFEFHLFFFLSFHKFLNVKNSI